MAPRVRSCALREMVPVAYTMMPGRTANPEERAAGLGSVAEDAVVESTATVSGGALATKLL